MRRILLSLGLLIGLSTPAFAIDTYRCNLTSEGEPDETSTLIIDIEHKRFKELDPKGKEAGGWADATIEGNKLEPRYYNEYEGNLFEFDLSTGKGEMTWEGGTVHYDCTKVDTNKEKSK